MNPNNTEEHASDRNDMCKFAALPWVTISGFPAATLFVTTQICQVRSRERACSNPPGHHAGSHTNEGAICSVNAVNTSVFTCLLWQSLGCAVILSQYIGSCTAARLRNKGPPYGCEPSAIKTAEKISYFVPDLLIAWARTDLAPDPIRCCSCQAGV